MRRLPGDVSERDDVESMIRVNHAGEYGAIRIYAGQRAMMKKSSKRSLIDHMAEQEQRHLETFESLMHARQLRPTIFMPLWHIAGYALGAATALMGEKAAFACTVAVESVIDNHYGAQEARLSIKENDLKQMITQFRADEKEHHDTSLSQGAEDTPFYPVLSAGVKAASWLAIWLSTRM